MCGETVVRLRAGTRVDPYSKESVEDWEAVPSELEMVTQVPAEPVTSTEPTDDPGRNAVVLGWVLYLDEEADITERDRVRVRGDDFEVIGRPDSWVGAGLVVRCQRVKG